MVLSARNLGEVVVPRPEGKVLRRFGANVLSEQHHVTVQPDGGFLAFNNGVAEHRSTVVMFAADGTVQWELPLHGHTGACLWPGLRVSTDHEQRDDPDGHGLVQPRPGAGT